MLPLAILTLAFPILMNEVARQAVAFFARFGTTLIADRLVPFSILIIGFFPITITLVVALESFVGEKERGTIEPLLNAPVKDWHLYCGKLLVGILVTVERELSFHWTVPAYGLAAAAAVAGGFNACSVDYIDNGARPAHGQCRTRHFGAVHIDPGRELTGFLRHHPGCLDAAGRERALVLGNKRGPLAGGVGGDRDGSRCWCGWAWRTFSVST